MGTPGHGKLAASSANKQAVLKFEGWKFRWRKQKKKSQSRRQNRKAIGREVRIAVREEAVRAPTIAAIIVEAAIVGDPAAVRKVVVTGVAKGAEKGVLLAIATGVLKVRPKSISRS